MDRFIVGTGRCGSTLLSRMLACHPAVCSIFEFFNGLDFDGDGHVSYDDFRFLQGPGWQENVGRAAQVTESARAHSSYSR